MDFLCCALGCPLQLDPSPALAPGGLSLSASWWRKQGDGAWRGGKSVTGTSPHWNRFKCNPGLIRVGARGGEKGQEAEPRGPREGSGQKSFHITSPLLGPRCPSSTCMHMTIRFQVPPPLWVGLHMRQKLNRNLETEAHGAETPHRSWGTGAAAEADFPLALPRAGLPLSQGFHVGTGDWLETRPFGLSLLPLTWGGGPPSPNSQQDNEQEPLCIPHAPALLPGCRPLPQPDTSHHGQLMGWLAFQVSGNRIQVGFQDF